MTDLKKDLVDYVYKKFLNKDPKNHHLDNSNYAKIIKKVFIQNKNKL